MMQNHKNKVLTVKQREKVLTEIGLYLKKYLGEKILSATVYGSTLCEDFCTESDFDILLIFDKLGIEEINKLRKIRLSFSKRKIKIDFNIHLKSELPKVRNRAYWHNNRALFIQKELELYGKQIIGKNLFKNTYFLDNEIKLETVRMINSLLYQTRKILINGEMDCNSKLKIMKFCIYAVLYSLAFANQYPTSRKDAFNLFKKNYKTKINPVCFFDIKIKKTKKISTADIKMAFEFLSEIDKKIYQLYKYNGIKN